MNNEQLSGKWKEFKGEVRSMWGKITDDELEATKGDAQAIEGLVLQRYGEKKDEAKKKVSGLINKYEIKKDQFIDRTKSKLRH